MMRQAFQHAPICLALLAAAASADWPTDANAPLFIGAAVGPDTQRHSITVTDDGAVWIGWQDPYCLGDLRLQRVSFQGDVLAPGGVITQPDPTCGFVMPPELVPSANHVVFARAFAELATDSIQRIGPDGQETWNHTVPTNGDFYDDQHLAKLFPLQNDEFLLVTQSYFLFHIDRLNSAGQSVWDAPVVLDPGSASADVLTVVDDGADGVFLFYDMPTSYRRAARVTRIAHDGSILFPPLSPTPVGELEGHSRHTTPVAIPDGLGGVVFIWTKGFESDWTPAPLLMQRIGPDGSLAFPIEGHRIALTPERQFDPLVERDPATGDLFITWRDDLPGSQDLKAQRITLEGDRLWGDNGVGVAPLDHLLGRYAPIWWDDALVIPVTGPQGVDVHRITPEGVVEPNPQPISPPSPARAIRATQVDNGIVVVWHTAQGFENDLLAQRLNPGGRLGNPPCNAADFAAPYGQLDFFDVADFLAAFADQHESADIVHDGAFNIFDITVYLGAFSSGCP